MVTHTAPDAGLRARITLALRLSGVALTVVAATLVAWLRHRTVWFSLRGICRTLVAHGGLQCQRVMRVVSLYGDGAETRAALEEVGRVKRAAGARVHFLSYDRLLQGKDVEQILRTGIAPLVQKHSGPAEGPHILNAVACDVHAGGFTKLGQLQARAVYGKASRYPKAT